MMWLCAHTTQARNVTLREFYLVGHAALVLLEARYRLRHKSVEQLRRWARADKPRRAKFYTRQELQMAFRRAVKWWGGTCLVRALALQRLLARNGHISELRIGVTNSGGSFEAHAWLIDGDEILDDGGREIGEFTLLTSWPSGQVRR